MAVSGKQTGLQLPCMDVQNIEGKTLFSFTDYVSRVIPLAANSIICPCQKNPIECDEHIVKKQLITVMYTL